MQGRVRQSGAAQATAVTSIREIGEGEWSRIAAGTGIHFSYPWLSLIEESGETETSYLVVESRDHRLAGGLPIHLLKRPTPGLSAYDPYGAAVAPAGCRSGQEAWLPSLLGGSRSGFLNRLAIDPTLNADERRAVAGALVERFLELPADVDAKSAAFMYAPAELVGELEGRLPESSAVLLSQVNLSIPVAWVSLDDYVASLSAKRRATVRRDLARFAASGIEVRELGLEDTYSFAPALLASVEARYGSSAGVEFWNPRLRQFAAYFGSRARAFVGFRDGRALCLSLAIVWDDTLYVWAWGADDERVGDHAEYFNLSYYRAIGYAIRERLATISLGIGAARAKLLRGATAVPVYNVLIAPAAREEESCWADWNRRRFAELDAELSPFTGPLPEAWQLLPAG